MRNILTTAWLPCYNYCVARSRFLAALLILLIAAAAIIVFWVYQSKEPKLPETTERNQTPTAPPTFELPEEPESSMLFERPNFPRFVSFTNLQFSDNTFTADNATFLKQPCTNVSGEFNETASLFSCQAAENTVQFYLSGQQFQLAHPQLQMQGTINDQSLQANLVAFNKSWQIRQNWGNPLSVYTDTLDSKLPCPEQPVLFRANQLAIQELVLPAPVINYNPNQGIQFSSELSPISSVKGIYNNAGEASFNARNIKLPYPLSGAANLQGMFKAPPRQCPDLEAVRQSNGLIDIKISQLIIYNLNLPKLAQDVRGDVSMQSLTSGTYLNGQTNLGNIQTEAYWQNEQLLFQDTQAQFNGGSVLMNGTLSPFTQTTDITFAIKFNTLPAEAPPLQLTINGNLEQPAIGLKDTGFARFIAGRKLRGIFGN